eukprot:12768511-Alexandrium_andersonii.AAC.1
MGCEITTDCDISYCISSTCISSARTGNHGPESGPSSSIVSEVVNDVDVLMSIAQAVFVMREKPSNIAPLTGMMVPALTVATLAYGPERPSSESLEVHIA